MKKLSILALSAVVSIAPAFAEVNSTATPAKTTAQEMELSFAFDDAENLQATDMTLVEMQETQGAWVPYAIGGAIGGISYVSGCAYTKCTVAGLGKSVVGGALVPMRGAQAIYGASKLAFAGGTINGIGNRKGWW
jgi:hypothetical protein